MGDEKIRIANLNGGERIIIGTLSLEERKNALVYAAQRHMKDIQDELFSAVFQEEQQRVQFAYRCIQEIQRQELRKGYQEVVDTFSLLLVRDHLFQALGHTFGQAKELPPNAAFFLLLHCTQYIQQEKILSTLPIEGRQLLEEGIFQWAMHAPITILPHVEHELSFFMRWLRLLVTTEEFYR